MSEANKRSTLYVELDALFDTRMAILFQYGEEVVMEAFKENYANRRVDEFPGVDRADFEQRYAKRDRDVLLNAQITPVAEIIMEFIHRTIKASGATPFQYNPRVILNVHPYQLLSDEIEVIENGLRQITDDLCEIQVVNRSREEVTPTWVRQECQLLFMYDYWNWLELHSANKNFEKTACPLVQLHGPALFKSSSAIKEVGSYDPFMALEIISSPIIKVVHHSASVFSIDLNRFVTANRPTD